MSNILYVTFDGLLQPLGNSQVVRYVEGLSRRGFDYTVLSMERSEDLRNVGRVDRLRQYLADRGIGWIYGEYSAGGAPGDAAKNMGWMAKRAIRLARERPLELIHARSYLGASVAYAVDRLIGVPYLFDIRGYWIDERLSEDRWFTNPVVHRVARALERRLYGRAAGLVALTTVSAGDVLAGRFGPWDPQKPLTVIPTCADYSRFQPGSADSSELPELQRLRDSNKLVVGYVGSINPAYHVDESLQLFRRLKERRHDAHLLAVTHQENQMSELLGRHGITASQATVISVPHSAMPAVYDLIDWGFLVIERSYARRAMMPTKLAEFFAAGVRPIYYGCNSEIRHWVERAETGVVLDNITTWELDRCARQIANRSTDQASLRRARRLTRAHFGLAAGIDAYERICRVLLGVAESTEYSPQQATAMERAANRGLGSPFSQ